MNMENKLTCANYENINITPLTTNSDCDNRLTREEAMPNLKQNRMGTTVTLLLMILLLQGTQTMGLLHSFDGKTEEFLDSFNDLFMKKSLRPSGDLNNPTAVNISISLYAVLGVNEKDQLLTTFVSLQMLWFNYYAKWKPERYNGIKEISVPVQKMWVPDIVILQFVGEDRSPQSPYLTVDHTGGVRLLKTIRVVSTCKLNIFRFPFDIQNCSLTFASSLNSGQHIKLGLLMTNGSSERFTTDAHGEWELVQTQSSYTEDIVTFNIIIKRRPALYVVNLLVPSVFLMVIDVCSFNLPPHKMDRASFKMTLLLGYTVFLLIINNMLPATSSGTPLIGIYFSVCLALLVIGLLQTIFVMNVMHQGSSPSPIAPLWLRTLVLHYLSILVCYKNQSQFDPELQHNTVPEASANGDNISVMATQVESSQGQQTQRFLCNISADLQIMRQRMENDAESQEVAEEWLHIGLILDPLVYRLYLLFMVVYAVTLGSVWGTWYLK